MSEMIRVKAQTLLEHGYSVIPVRENKRSFGSWKEYQQHPIKIEEIPRRFNGAKHMAIICGQVSGSLENLDIDDVECRDALVSMIKAKHADILDKLVFTKTPNGYGIVYRYQGKVPGNLKLAMTWDEVEGPGEYEWNDRASLQAKQVDGKWVVSACRLETRGEAGYFLTAPSPGYEILEGSFENLQPISKSERDSIIAIAKTFDLRPLEEEVSETGKVFDSRKKIPWPGDIYNDNVDFEGLLLQYGWKRHGKTTDGVTYSRPGKTEKVGATLYNDGKLHIFSSNASPLEEGKQYTAFGVLAAMEFGNDWSTATKHIIEEGFEVHLTEAELKEILEDNPDQLEEAYNRSGLPESTVSQIAMDCGIPLPQGRRPGRIEVLYDKLELNRVVTECDAAMAAVEGEWGYYNYSGRVGYVTKDNTFMGYDKESLELRAEQSLYMTQWNIQNKKPKLEPIRVHTHVLNKLLVFPDSSAPKIIGFAQHPVVVNGEVIGIHDGFHKGIMFQRCTEMGFKVDDRSWMECYNRIVELFCDDILFKDKDLGQALFVSMMLTGLTRLGIPGGCPGYFITANEPGTGKSTLFEFISRIVYGRNVQSVDWGTDQVERRKEIISCLREGVECFVFDNIQQGEEVKSPILAQALSAGEFKSRVMGKGEMVHVQAQSLFVFIGNNLNMSTELARRLMTVELLASSENPARRKVKIKRIAEFCEAHRVEVVGCLLKMILEGEGMDDKIKRESGFTFWDKIVRNPILAQTGLDIMQGFEVSSDNSEENYDIASSIELLAAVFGVGPGNSFTTRELYLAIAEERWLSDDERISAAEIIQGVEEDAGVLKDAMISLNGRAAVSIKSLGKCMSQLDNRVTGNKRFVRHKTKSKKPIQHWVEIVEKGDEVEDLK